MTDIPQKLLDSILDRQHHSLREGNRPTIDSLLDGTPFAGDNEARLDLLYNEIVTLEELGESPSLDDYVTRYPELEQDLQVHFEIHRAVSANFLELTSSPVGDTWPQHAEAGYLPGTCIDDYEIVGQVGQGGMGIVFRAHDHRLRRDVALKMFQPDRAPTPREAQRFQTEAEAMARLAHPNIVPIFEVGVSKGRPFLALELAERGTLTDQLQRTVFSPTAAARLIETLARAVDHAHRQQVIHRDLKPANILFTADGTPKITDFGLAKVLENDPRSLRDATRTGEPMGTPRYMAPEQASGQTDRIGPATDIYSLGTLLYECLTGTPPFVATSVVETMQMIRNDAPVSPARHKRGIPRDLITICLKCLEKDPARRYPTAASLAEDLHCFQFGRPILARRTPAWEHAWKWSRRRPAHAALIAIAMLFSTGSLAVLLLGRQAENRRLQRVRSDIAELVRHGQGALEQGEVELAHARFRDAWQLVQAEPALVDHQTGISGWLDHSQRALDQQQWKRRAPPREFDSRRDLALMESLLLDPLPPSPIASARESIAAAMELTSRGDPAWQGERERLTLVEAELIAAQSNADQALTHLDSQCEFSSRQFLERRARFLTQLGRTQEAEQVRIAAEQFPRDVAKEYLLEGMDQMRQRNFQQGLANFESLMMIEPANYTGRLFQAMCFLNLRRYGEARVALSACQAQRPDLYCNEFLHGQACLELGDVRAAIQDFQRVLEMNPSDSVRLATERHLQRAQSLLPSSSDVTSSR
jgi:tetratricopeptide (TPR) repeat protein